MNSFWRVLIINRCWILSKGFSASIELILCFLSFSLLIWCITFIEFCILKNPCIPGINPTWSCYMSFMMCCWILYAKILLRIFGSMFISDIGLYFSFFVLSLVLGSGWWWPHRMSLEVFFPLQFFESFRRIGVSSSLNVWQNSPVKPSGPGLCFLGDFFYHSFNFSDCNWIVHNFYFSWFSLGRLNFSKNLPFLPGYLFYCHIIVHHMLF